MFCLYINYMADNGNGMSNKELLMLILSNQEKINVRIDQLHEKVNAKISSLEKGIILDPFMGTGTTGIVANELGYDFIGIEIDEEYFDLSGHRIQEASKS